MSYYVSGGNNPLTLGNIVLQGSNTNWSTATLPTSATYTLGASTGTFSIAQSQYESAVKINQDGIEMPDGTDLVIGGRGIKKMLEGIEQRLAILEPNLQLESEWEELKRLGEEYRALEKEIQEKMKTWEILKK